MEWTGKRELKLQRNTDNNILGQQSSVLLFLVLFSLAFLFACVPFHFFLLPFLPVSVCVSNSATPSGKE